MDQNKTTQKTARSTPDGKKSKSFTDDEKAAMKERAKELKASQDKADEANAALAAIDALQEPDRGMARRVHAIILDSTHALSAKTWYGMPAYANKDSKIVCFYKPAQKFKARYAELGFNDAANLDEGGLWPVSYALKELTPTEEAKIRALVKKAVS